MDLLDHARNLDYAARTYANACEQHARAQMNPVALPTDPIEWASIKRDARETFERASRNLEAACKAADKDLHYAGAKVRLHF